MGRWVYKVEKARPLKSYFRGCFFAGLILNFIALLSLLNVKYYDREVTKAIWLGAISGFGFSTCGFILMSVFSGISNRIGTIVALVIWLIGVVFGIVYNYKKNKWLWNVALF